MRSIRYLCLALVLLAAILVTACGGAATTTSTPGSTPTQTTTAPKPTQTSTSTTTAPATTPVSTTTKPPSATGSKSGGKLTIVTGVLPDGIFSYPPKVVNGASLRIAGHIMEGLYKMQGDNTLTPLLAESWDIDVANKAITFHLRKGVKFMDGTDFNAQAVKWNFDNQIAAKKTPLWKSVEVIDDYTVKVNFVMYSNTVLQNFADLAGFIVSPTAYQKNGEEYMYGNVVSTGAYKISNFSRDVSVTMEKNPGYWQTGKPYLNNVTYQFIPDNMTAWAYVQTGAVDVWWTTAQYISEGTKKGFQYVGRSGTVMSLVPDSANADSPWSNLKVRQAAEYAIDREAIANAFGYGLLKVPYQLPAETSPAYIPNLQGRKYDPAKAKQLLTEAGYAGGFKTTINCQIGSNTNKDEVQAIQSYLQAVGIKAEVLYWETAKYYEYRNGTWKNGLVFEPIALNTNYNANINLYFAKDATTFKSLARSEAFLTALANTMATTYPDAKLQQATCQTMFDDAMVIPTSQRVTFWMMQPNSKVRDLGLLTRHFDLFFNTEDAYFEK